MFYFLLFKNNFSFEKNIQILVLFIISINNIKSILNFIFKLQHWLNLLLKIQRIKKKNYHILQ